MIDPIELADLGQLIDFESVGGGNQAQVWRLPPGALPGQSGRFVFKKYKPATAGELEPDAIDELIAWRLALSDLDRDWLDARFCWPRLRVEHEASVCGVVLPHIPDAFYFDVADRPIEQGLDFIYIPTSADKIQMPTPDSKEQVLSLFEHLAESLAFLEMNDMHHGDLSQGNVLWSKDLDSYLIDCDGTFLHGRSAAQVQGTPGWVDPRVKRGEISAPDNQSDVRAFACGLVRCLTRADQQIESEIDAVRLPDGTPAIVERLLRRSIEENTKPPSFNEWSAHLREQLDSFLRPSASAPDPDESAGSTDESATRIAEPSGNASTANMSFWGEQGKGQAAVRLLRRGQNLYRENDLVKRMTVAVVVISISVILAVRFAFPSEGDTLEPGVELSQALNNSEGPFRLKAGRYFLDAPVQSTIGLEISGAGQNQTTIFALTNLTAITVESAPAIISDLTVTRLGVESDSPLIHAIDSELALNDLTISEPGGPGLLVGGESTGEIRSVIVDSSASSGIIIGGTTKVTITSTSSNNNQINGFEWTDQSVVSIQSSQARGNQRSGFSAKASAEITGKDLLAVSNVEEGFKWAEDSGGTIEQSTAESNKSNGFMVGGRAEVDLTGNTSATNLENGMYWEGATRGLVSDNVSSENNRHGFAIVTSVADLRFDSNRSVGSSEGGFYWARGGEIDAYRNFASNNTSGFVIADEYELELFEGNQSKGNDEFGIHVAGSGRGVLESNSSIDNGRDGIAISLESSSVEIRNSVVTENDRYGIYIQTEDNERVIGFLNQNQIFSNGEGSIGP